MGMKRILASIFFVLMLSAKVYAGDYYLVGVDAFKKGSYDKAASNLEHAIRISPKNVNARYYLAQVYLSQNRIPDAKNQYQRIMILAPASEAGILSQKGLYLITQAYVKSPVIGTNDLLAKYPDNYLQYVLNSDGSIMKWHAFPISVYIEPTQQKASALKAFIQWQTKSKNLVKFNLVPTKENAQISVDFKTKLEENSSGEGFIAGYSKPYAQNNKLTKSEIHILTVDPQTNKKLDDSFIYASTLHEIGHSLGFRGHSPNSNDIMSATASTPKTELTQRDINTLLVFYRIDKNTLMAKSKGQPDVRLQQALDYAKKSPEKSVSWGQLGDIYRNKKMYVEAVRNYKKAIAIEPKADFYNLLGSTYQEMGNKESAYVNLKQACDIEKSNTFYLYQFAQNCLISGHKPVGEAYVKAFIKANPQSVSDEKIQNVLKLYNLK